MYRQSAVSSHIDFIGYEDRILEVGFKNGRIYRCQGVPDSVANSFLKASSHGRYFHTQIKNRYQPRRIT